MDPKTVKAYVALLEQMFLVQRLPAWRPGLGARESSTPKIYVCDSGLLAHLLGADERRVEDDDQVTGKVCETFVAGELLKHASWADRACGCITTSARGRTSTWCSRTAAETLRRSRSRPEPRSHRRTGDGSRSSATLADHSFRAGVIVYSGSQTLPLGDRLWAVPFAALWA